MEEDKIEKYTTEINNETLREIFNTYRKKYFNPSLEYSDDRVNLVSSVIEDEHLKNIIESKKYVLKQIKIKSNPLAENEPLSNYLSQVADYLLFCSFKNETHKDEWETFNGKVKDNVGKDNLKLCDDDGKVIEGNYFNHTEGYTILTNTGLTKLRKMEISLENYLSIMNSAYEDMEDEDKNRLLDDYKKSTKREPLYEKVTPEDYNRYYELKEVKKNIDSLNKRLGHGKQNNEKQVKKESVMSEFDKKINVIGFQEDYIRHTYKNVRKLVSPSTKEEWLEWKITPLVSQIIRLEDEDKASGINVHLEEIEQLKEKIHEYKKMILEPMKEVDFWKNELFLRNVTECLVEDGSDLGFPVGYTKEKYYHENTKLHNALKYESEYMKDRLRSPITFKKIMKGSNIYDYDYSCIDFSNTNQIFELVRNYWTLRDNHHIEFNDVWAALEVLDELIEMTYFNEEELYVIDSFKSNVKVTTIVKRFNLDNGTDYNDKKIRSIIMKSIPKKIADAYNTDRDEYLMDSYEVKGKKCSKCGLIKLACKRNFSPDRTGKMGLLSICRVCR